MSNVSGASADFDFWEFVNCGICHLEFVKDTGTLSSMPFWLTECGHVVCNSHLSTDRSCAVCSSPGIQLMPLQRELEPPMANWFNSVPNAFDTVAYSLRFQMDTMVNLVRYFKKKYQQYRPLYQRLQDEHAETKRLRKLVDELKLENKQLRQRLQMGGSDDVDRFNTNGKRLRADVDDYRSVHCTSSPRSGTTPLGPDRLTLPPERHQPNFNSRQSLQAHASSKPQHSLGHYAYVPPRSSQAQTMAVPTLSHLQSGSARRARGRGGGMPESVMPPPPIPTGRFESRASMDTWAQMPPPPTPQLDLDSRLLPRRQSLLPATPQMSPGGSQRFALQTPSKASQTAPPAPRAFFSGTQPVQRQQSLQTQRFIPSGSVARLPTMTPARGSGSLAGSASVAQTPSGVKSVDVSGRGQRTPFVPGNGETFS